VQDPDADIPPSSHRRSQSGFRHRAANARVAGAASRGSVSSAELADAFHDDDEPGSPPPIASPTSTPGLPAQRSSTAVDATIATPPPRTMEITTHIGCMRLRLFALNNVTASSTEAVAAPAPVSSAQVASNGIVANSSSGGGGGDVFTGAPAGGRHRHRRGGSFSELLTSPEAAPPLSSSLLFPQRSVSTVGHSSATVLSSSSDGLIAATTSTNAVDSSRCVFEFCEVLALDMEAQVPTAPL
jgi:hypothetical protein